MTYTQIYMDPNFNDLNPILAGSTHTVGPFGGPARCLQYTLVHYVLRGSGFLHINGQTLPVHAGQAFLIPSGQFSSYRADPQDPWQYRWVGFTGTLSHSFERFPYVFDLPQEFLSTLCDPAAPDMSLEQAARLLTAELFSLYALLSSRSAQTPVKETADLDKQIFSIMDYIQQHHTEKLSISQIASTFHLDRTYLNKRFKQKVGRSIQQYITEARIMTAMQLIENNASFQDAARQSGFGDYSNFFKVFTREIGMLPADYKKMVFDNFEAFRKYGQEHR